MKVARQRRDAARQGRSTVPLKAPAWAAAWSSAASTVGERECGGLERAEVDQPGARERDEIGRGGARIHPLAADRHAVAHQPVVGQREIVLPGRPSARCGRIRASASAAARVEPGSACGGRMSSAASIGPGAAAWMRAHVLRLVAAERDAPHARAEAPLQRRQRLARCGRARPRPPRPAPAPSSPPRRRNSRWRR